MNEGFTLQTQKINRDGPWVTGSDRSSLNSTFYFRYCVQSDIVKFVDDVGEDLFVLFVFCPLVVLGPPLPDLPAKSFKSVVRAVLLDKNVTIEAREYVSETANAATLVIMYQGQQNTIVMDYNTDQAFYISPNPETTAAGNQPHRWSLSSLYL